LGALERVDAKLKRLRAIEASYRQEIRWAQADLKRDPDHRHRYERAVEKSERKIAKILPKIHAMIERRERVREHLR